MGSVGNQLNIPSMNSDDYHQFNYGRPEPWLRENTNWSDLSPETSEERTSVEWYTSAGYGDINYELYHDQWDNIPDFDQANIQNIQNFLSRSELYSGVEVTRGTDFTIFGSDERTMSVDDIKAFLLPTDGVVQNDAFMSFTVMPDAKGIFGRNMLQIKLRIPPSKGAGAYIADYSTHDGEREFLLNNNAVLKFDTNSIKQREDGKIEITAYWLGQAKKRTIDK